VCFSENRSKFARVHAICACAWTRRGAPGGADRGNTANPIRGSLVLGESVQKFVEGYFQLKALGASRIKGVSEPVNVYEVTGLGLCMANC
jgi:hypothetical protein